MELDSFLEYVKRRHPNEPAFYQAVEEVAQSVIPFINEHPEYEEARVLERLVEPDRIISFRVCWEDDEGRPRINRGYRVQQSNAIGPYKGGLRFAPSVSQEVFKFLAFEQVLKDSLTTLPMGGAKGGADFDPKGKSDAEVRRFCQAFMTELVRHIGPRVDVPAGDIGVGTREIGYLFGQYKRLRNTFDGGLTGKGLAFGGSPVRTEATGYGAVYFACAMLDVQDETLHGKRCLLSGAGNAALYTAQKLIEMNARVVTLSDRKGFIYAEGGLKPEQLNDIVRIKLRRDGTLADYAEESGVPYYEGEKPWGKEGDFAFPSATQNEIEGEDAAQLIENGCRAVFEVANMPSTRAAAKQFREEEDLLYGPSKAVNAGGVAVSGLEITQNATRLPWSRDETDERLQDIMQHIHARCVEYGQSDGQIDYVKGANLAGFIKVADAMLAYGMM